jgi:CheY-like chemotaxis protein
MKTILIAEDNAYNFRMYPIILKDLGINILHALNGKEAIEITTSNPEISLILMDMNMPEMSGEEAAVIIKEAYSNIPIISITAYTVMGKVNDENRKYFCEFITKPFNVNNLKEIVRKYLSDEN